MPDRHSVKTKASVVISTFCKIESVFLLMKQVRAVVPNQGAAS